MFYLFYIIVRIIHRAGLETFVDCIQPTGFMFDTPMFTQKLCVCVCVCYIISYR